MFLVNERRDSLNIDILCVFVAGMSATMEAGVKQLSLVLIESLQLGSVELSGTNYSQVG